jgi:hypothetical protein
MKPKRPKSKRRSAIDLESERSMRELIRVRLSLPPEKRIVNVLRKRIGPTSTAL